jgi:hypothetical protein
VLLRWHWYGYFLLVGGRMDNSQFEADVAKAELSLMVAKYFEIYPDVTNEEIRALAFGFKCGCQFSISAINKATS